MGVAVASAPARALARTDGVESNRQVCGVWLMKVCLPTSAAEAVNGRDVVFTMLNDDEAVRDVVLGNGGVAEAMAAGAIHVSLSTISVQLSERSSRKSIIAGGRSSSPRRSLGVPMLPRRASYGSPSRAMRRRSSASGRYWRQRAGASPSSAASRNRRTR